MARASLIMTLDGRSRKPMSRAEIKLRPANTYHLVIKRQSSDGAVRNIRPAELEEPNIYIYIFVLVRCRKISPRRPPAAAAAASDSGERSMPIDLTVRCRHLAA